MFKSKLRTISFKSSLVKVLFILLGSTTHSMGQLNNSFFEDKPISQIDTLKKLTVKVNVLSFLKNNEYFNPLVDGYTLFGQLIAPNITYQASSTVQISAGGFFRKDFGNSGFYQISPTFTINYKKNGINLLFGNLDGHLNHKLIEPLFNFERVMTNQLEHGIQLKTNKKRLVTDTWIDWQSMIYKGSDFQEEIWGGSSLSFRLSEKRDNQIIGQFTAKHKGGQINIGTAPIQTTLNMAIGVQLALFKNNQTFLRELNCSQFFTAFTSDNPKWPTQNNGYGILSSVNAKTKWVDLTLNYWKSNKYISPIGGDLYQSVSTNFLQPNTSEVNREILIFRIMKELKMDENLSFLLRIEPYFNLKSSEMEHSESIFLRYTFAKKIKMSF